MFIIFVKKNVYNRNKTQNSTVIIYLFKAKNKERAKHKTLKPWDSLLEFQNFLHKECANDPVIIQNTQTI